MTRTTSKGRLRWVSSIGTFLLVTAVIGVVCVIVFLLYLRTQALPVALVAQTSYILDYHGDIIDTLDAGQKRQVVKLSQIAPSIVQATLAIEDHRFYDHHGIDLRGLARAVAVNVQHMSKVQGASTLTQQLARNLYLNHDRTWSRKINEATLAIQLEMRFTKDEILEKYLNQIYYGHATYGIQAAAQLYFAKDASDLSLAESALLAGVPKGPKYYSPYMDRNNAKKRQQTVLYTMVQHGFITSEEAKLAYAEPLHYQTLTGGQASEAPYFRDYIKQIALDRLGISEQLLKEGGIKIHTTLDLSAQHHAEQVIAKEIETGSELQTALIAVDPRNGYIKAMVGGIDYAKNQYNRTLADTRQPGSSFKPIVYLTALSKNEFTPLTRYRSEPTLFTYDEGRETYMPSNFNDRYTHDFIDMRKAIAQSDNIYAVQTIMNVGAEEVITMARALGIQSAMKPLPSLALGTFPVSPLEMASAFGTIANLGVRVEPIAVLRIEDNQGNLLYEARPIVHQVIDASYAYVLTHMMEGVFEPGGTANRVASIIKRPVAGKTGTTNTDAWMVGFTPELSVAVWVGHDKSRAITSVESHKAAPIFAQFLEQTLEPVPPKIFPIPDGVVSAYIDVATGTIATAECPESQLEVFVKGTEPTELCSEHGAPLEAEEPHSEESDVEQSWWKDLKRWWAD
ncbi:MAG: PBP1A family penicillin-binding protein [Paenibacillaceae bacterium]